MSWFVRDQICAGKPAKTHTWKALKLRIFCIFLKSFHQLIDLFHRRCSHILQPAVKKADWKPENINKRGQNLAYTWHIRVTAVWLWFVALSWALLCEWSCASPFPHTLPENKSVHHVYPPQPPRLYWLHLPLDSFLSSWQTHWFKLSQLKRSGQTEIIWCLLYRDANNESIYECRHRRRATLCPLLLFLLFLCAAYLSL